MRKSSAKRIISVLLVAIILATASGMLFACDEKSEENAPIERSIYVYKIDLPEQSDVANVYVSFSKGELGQKIDGVSAKWESESYKINVWYNGSNSYFTLNPDSIFSALREQLPQESLIKDDVVYNRLKVIFRYDTIYKSIKSDGEVSRNGRTYTHTFELDEASKEVTYKLSVRSANSASWYSVLIASALMVAIIGTIVYLSIKSEVWQKKKRKE